MFYYGLLNTMINCSTYKKPWEICASRCLEQKGQKEVGLLVYLDGGLN